jgi:hypothetical protein
MFKLLYITALRRSAVYEEAMRCIFTKEIGLITMKQAEKADSSGPGTCLSYFVNKKQTT